MVDNKVGADQGVPPQAGSGHSAKPEPCSTVSAVPASVPNADPALAWRVAMAIYREYENRPIYAQGQMNGILAAELAVAAIKAMREPTQAMIDAAAATPGMAAASSAMVLHQARGYGFDAEAFKSGSPLHQAWRAMIDAATVPVIDVTGAASAIEARRVETERLDAKHESADPKGDAQPIAPSRGDPQ